MISHHLNELHGGPTAAGPVQHQVTPYVVSVSLYHSTLTPFSLTSQALRFVTALKPLTLHCVPELPCEPVNHWNHIEWDKTLYILYGKLFQQRLFSVCSSGMITLISWFYIICFCICPCGSFHVRQIPAITWPQ